MSNEKTIELNVSNEIINNSENKKNYFIKKIAEFGILLGSSFPEALTPYTFSAKLKVLLEGLFATSIISLNSTGTWQTSRIDLTQESLKIKAYFAYILHIVICTDEDLIQIMTADDAETLTPGDIFYLKFNTSKNYYSNLAQLENSMGKTCNDPIQYVQSIWELLNAKQVQLTTIGLAIHDCLKFLETAAQENKYYFLTLLGKLHYKFSTAIKKKFIYALSPNTEGPESEVLSELCRNLNIMSGQFLLYGLCLNDTCSILPVEERERLLVTALQCLEYDLDAQNNLEKFYASINFGWIQDFNLPLIDTNLSSEDTCKQSPFPIKLFIARLKQQYLFINKLNTILGKLPFNFTTNDQIIALLLDKSIKKLLEISKLENILKKNYPVSSFNNHFLNLFSKRNYSLLDKVVCLCDFIYKLPLHSHHEEDSNVEWLNKEYLHACYKVLDLEMQEVIKNKNVVTILEHQFNTQKKRVDEDCDQWSFQHNQLRLAWIVFSVFSNPDTHGIDLKMELRKFPDALIVLFFLNYANYHELILPSSFKNWLKYELKHWSPAFCGDIILYFLGNKVESSDDKENARILNKAIRHHFDSNRMVKSKNTPKEFEYLPSEEVKTNAMIIALFTMLKKNLVNEDGFFIIKKFPLDIKLKLYRHEECPKDKKVNLLLKSFSTEDIQSRQAILNLLEEGFIQNIIPLDQDSLKKLSDCFVWTHERIEFLSNFCHTNISLKKLFKVFIYLFPSFEEIQGISNLDSANKCIANILELLNADLVRLNKAKNFLTKKGWKLVQPTFTLEEEIEFFLKNSVIANKEDYNFQKAINIFQKTLKQSSTLEMQFFHVFINSLSSNVFDPEKADIFFSLVEERTPHFNHLLELINPNHLTTQFKQKKWNSLIKEFIQEKAKTTISSSFYKNWFQKFQEMDSAYLIIDIVYDLIHNNDPFFEEAYKHVPPKILNQLAPKVLSLLNTLNKESKKTKKSNITKPDLLKLDPIKLESILLNCHLDYLNSLYTQQSTNINPLAEESVKYIISALISLMSRQDEYENLFLKIVLNEKLANRIATSLIETPYSKNQLDKKINLLEKFSKINSLSYITQIQLISKKLQLELSRVDDLKKTEMLKDQFNVLWDCYLLDPTSLNDYLNCSLWIKDRRVLPFLIESFWEWAEKHKNIHARLLACQMYKKLCEEEKWYENPTELFTLYKIPLLLELNNNIKVDDHWKNQASQILTSHINKLLEVDLNKKNHADKHQECLDSLKQLEEFLVKFQIYDFKFTECFARALSSKGGGKLNLHSNDKILYPKVKQMLFKQVLFEARTNEPSSTAGKLLFDLFFKQPTPDVHEAVSKDLDIYSKIPEKNRSDIAEYCEKYLTSTDMSETLTKKFFDAVFTLIPEIIAPSKIQVLAKICRTKKKLLSHLTDWITQTSEKAFDIHTRYQFFESCIFTFDKDFSIEFFNHLNVILLESQQAKEKEKIKGEDRSNFLDLHLAEAVCKKDLKGIVRCVGHILKIYASKETYEIGKVLDHLRNIILGSIKEKSDFIKKIAEAIHVAGVDTNGNLIFHYHNLASRLDPVQSLNERAILKSNFQFFRPKSDINLHPLKKIMREKIRNRKKRQFYQNRTFIYVSPNDHLNKFYLCQMAHECAMQGMLVEAINHWVEALKIFFDPYICFDISQAYSALGKDKSASYYFRQAILFLPEAEARLHCLLKDANDFWDLITDDTTVFLEGEKEYCLKQTQKLLDEILILLQSKIYDPKLAITCHYWLAYVHQELNNKEETKLHCHITHLCYARLFNQNGGFVYDNPNTWEEMKSYMNQLVNSFNHLEDNPLDAPTM